MSMNNLAFSPEGDWIVVARNILREGSIFALDIWDSTSGKKLQTLPNDPRTIEHSGTISSIAFAPGGQFLASGSRDHSIRLWDIRSGQCIEKLLGNSSEVWAVALTVDGQGILSGAKDGTIRLWPTKATEKEKFIKANWTPLKFSKDGKYLAAVDDKLKFALLNLKTGEPEEQLQLSEIRLLPYKSWPGAISDDLRVLVEPLPDGQLRIWDLQGRKSVDLAARKSNKYWMANWMAISPDGCSLLVGGERESAQWWNLNDLAETPISIKCNGARFSRNGSVLITLHDRSFKAWDAKMRVLKAEFTIEADFGYGTAFALSDDGSILAAGSNPIMETENDIQLWCTHDGKLLGLCKGHTQGVRWLAFAPNSATLASVGDDSTMRFWDVRTQQELLSTQRIADPIRNILFSPDGTWLVMKTMNGLRLLDASRDGIVTNNTTILNNNTNL
jgi:WD40 repeat protein